MNVFEFLGLSPDHRKEGKVVQLVKNLEEVSEKKIHWPLIGQIKYDGVYCMLVIHDSQVGFFGRTGKQLTNLDWLASYYEDLPSGVYIGELCLPGKSLEVLSGIVNPNRTKAVETDLEKYMVENARIYFHDYLSTEEFVSGRSLQCYTDRLYCLVAYGLLAVSFRLLHSDADVESFAKEAIAEGQEGVVLKQDVDWEAGHKGWRAMKRVRRIEYDLKCVGFEEGKGKYEGKVANLIFQWKNGDTIKAMLGKDYTHKDAEDMFNAINNDPYRRGGTIHEIFTVYGLQDSSKGKIRLPKVGEKRHDKDTPDF